MKSTIHNILLRYWGYSAFRSMQEEIITSVLNGNDTLALLPTGGGKSICFQVPTMASEGICIVISPLIALMKDQVANLQSKNIKAVAIYSGMTKSEIDICLDNCVYGDIKFLYVSPERIQTEIFIERLKKMKVCLLAIDEAHCISQWGYDFRPPYLIIAQIRQYIPNAPLLALTATATPLVVKDIQNKLLFKKENVFQKSFERKNLTYAVIEDENKDGKLFEIINNIKGSGIIYVRSRKKTKDIAVLLLRNKISADFYHAGLEPKVRDSKQNSWMKDRTRIIVSTNAFGMGIDKPNVRFVIHLDIPDSIEAYFQEAGRGGRDEQRAFAIIIYNQADLMLLDKNFLTSFPPISEIKKVYSALGNYLQLAIGSGKNISFDFNITHFADQYKMSNLLVYNALKFLEKEGYILLTEAINTPSKLHIPLSKDDLYKFQVINPYYDAFLKVILRSYTGLFDDFIKIDESDLAKKMNIKTEEVIALIQKLHKFSVLEYIPFKDKPQLIFTTERLDIKDITISEANYEQRKKTALQRLEAIQKYVSSGTKCRSQMLLEYFGQEDNKRCGTCDVCKNRNDININEVEFNTIVDILKPILKVRAMTIDEIFSTLKQYQKQKIIKTLQWLVDNEKIDFIDNIYYLWRTKI
ncbi:MAG: RecQ family ATP-dependent DNA helicase [Bacteroidales bacterium]|nr:RecQ family ATP-dependent DNA helicase [Bacteroidales bacterium]